MAHNNTSICIVYDLHNWTTDLPRKCHCVTLTALFVMYTWYCTNAVSEWNYCCRLCMWIKLISSDIGSAGHPSHFVQLPEDSLVRVPGYCFTRAFRRQISFCVGVFCAGEGFAKLQWNGTLASKWSNMLVLTDDIIWLLNLLLYCEDFWGFSHSTDEHWTITKE